MSIENRLKLALEHAEELRLQRNALIEASRYALKFIEEGCPKFDQIHTRTMLETALNATQREEGL